MVVIELKLFISIILPLATILFIVKGDSRKIVTFLLFGIIAELASNLIQNYLYVYVVDDLYFTTNIGPVIEEILKALPVLIFIFAFKPPKQLIYEVSIASGIGFAILENAFIIGADIYSTSLFIAFLRGIGAGMMHAVCTLAVGYGMSFIYKKRWFFIPGTFLFMFMAMVYHSIFNTLVQSKYQVIGLCIPIVTFIPLIIRIIGNNPDRDSNKRFFNFITDGKLSKKHKRIISAVAIVAIALVSVVSYVRSDGDRLTGGKNGIYGLLGSGMDIDQMVKAAMLTRQNEYDRMYKKEVKQKWLKEAYADLYSRLANAFDKYRMPETFAPMHVSSSNTNVVTAVANADALETTHTVCVKQLAGGGTEAIVSIDGKLYENDSNTIQVNNVTYFLNGIGGDDNSIDIIVSMDQDTVIENLRVFVEDYNNLNILLHNLYVEDVCTDYDVLTKEQEAEMSEDQIEKWNKKAKAGLLKESQTIAKMMSRMQMAIDAVIETADSEYNTTKSIGITYSDIIRCIQLDENKLCAALRVNSSAVYQIFCSADGVANRLYDSVQDILSEINKYAGTTGDPEDGSYLGNLVLNLKTKRIDFEEQMAEYEERLYKKYEAMNTPLSELQEMMNSLGLDSGSPE